LTANVCLPVNESYFSEEQKNLVIGIHKFNSKPEKVRKKEKIFQVYFFCMKLKLINFLIGNRFSGGKEYNSKKC